MLVSLPNEYTLASLWLFKFYPIWWVWLSQDIMTHEIYHSRWDTYRFKIKSRRSKNIFSRFISIVDLWTNITVQRWPCLCSIIHCFLLMYLSHRMLSYRWNSCNYWLFSFKKSFASLDIRIFSNYRIGNIASFYPLVLILIKCVHTIGSAKCHWCILAFSVLIIVLSLASELILRSWGTIKAIKYWSIMFISWAIIDSWLADM